jgi:hypothetical protein
MLHKGNVRISEVKVTAFDQYYGLQKHKGQIHNTEGCSLQQEKYSGVFE